MYTEIYIMVTHITICYVAILNTQHNTACDIVNFYYLVFYKMNECASSRVSIDVSSVA